MMCTQATGAIPVIACDSGLQFVSNEPGMQLASGLAWD